MAVKKTAPAAATKPVVKGNTVTLGAITLTKATVPAALKGLVPPAEAFTGYTDSAGTLEKLAWAVANNEDTLLMGPTGTGKTHAARALAAALELPYYRIPVNEATDETAFLGKMILNDKGGMEFQPGPVTRWAQTGGVLVLDEVNQAHADARIVLAPVHYSDEASLIVSSDQGQVIRRGEAKLPSILIATANPYEYGGTKEMGAQLMSRYGMVLTMDYLPGTEEVALLVSETGLDTETATKMVGAANAVRQAKDDDRVQFPMSYREVKTWARLTNTFGIAESAGFAVLGKITDPLERDGVRALLASHFTEQEWV